MDVLKKLRSLGKGESKEGDLKRRRDLYEFSALAQHGFPNKPTAVAYDSRLSLIAVGNQYGSIRIYGKPGVQFSAEISNESQIDKLAFLPNEGRLIVLCKDSTISLWELNVKADGVTVLEQVKSTSLNTESQSIAVSCCCLTENSEEILFGTENGNINVFNVKDFKLTDRVFGRDHLTKKTSDEARGSTGPIESLLQHPTLSDQFLVGFKSGLVTLWNAKDEKIEQIFTTGTSLESLVFRSAGEEFLVGHSDGSYTAWTTADSSKPKETATTTYGPFPCKAITKIDWKDSTGGETLFFCGGMTRSSYGDRHTLSVIQGNKHVVFDFSSRVIDFITLSTQGSDKADTLIILAEEELIAIDLETNGWPEFRLPYMGSIHNSTITSVLLLHDISKETWNKICAAGRAQFQHCSTRNWPLTGGSLNEESGKRHLLLTGHEDGSVSFWDASFVPNNHHLLLTIRTSDLFSDVATLSHPTSAAGAGEVTQGQAAASGPEEDWPPFRKAGRFDPYTDGARLAIQKIEFCPHSETLLVAGAAGQVIVLGLQGRGQQQQPASVAVDIVSRDSAQFSWTGHEALKQREDVGSRVLGCSENGFKTVCVAQLYPPAICTAVALQTDWKLFAVGTEHGYALIDYSRNTVVCSKSTLVPAGSTPRVNVTRSRSLQKTLRESFRKLRIKPPVSRSFDVVQHAADEADEKQRSKSDAGEPVAPTEMKTLSEESTAADAKDTEAKPEDGKNEGSEESKKQATEEEASVKTEAVTGATGEAAEQSAAAGDAAGDAAAVTAAEVVEPSPAVVEQQPADEAVGSESAGVTASEPREDEKTTDIASEASNQPAGEVAAAAESEVAPASPTAAPAVVELLEVGSAVQCLYFSQTYLLQGQPLTATLWVGNSLGNVTAYRLIVPSNDKRMEEDIQCLLAKEIHLRHGAGVLSLKIVNRDSKLVTVETPVESATADTQDAPAVASSAAAASSSSAGHRLIVCSQEQIKIFSLPSLKPQHKVKVASRHADAKIRNFSVAQFISKTESTEAEKQHETAAVVCLTGDGLVHIYSIPQLRKQFETAIANHDDMLATNSCVFTPEGFGFFLRSLSEMSSFSLSARQQGRVLCSVELPEGARPPPPQEAEVTAEAAAAAGPTDAATTEETEKPAQTSGEENGENATVVLNESALSAAAGDITTDSVKIHLTEEESTVASDKSTLPGSMVAETSTTLVANGNGAVEETSVKVERSSEVTEMEVSKEVESSSTETKTVEHISTDIEHLKHEAQKEFAKTEEALGVITAETSESVETKTTEGANKVDGVCQ